jgi:hypothetical protein
VVVKPRRYMNVYQIRKEEGQDGTLENSHVKKERAK